TYQNIEQFTLFGSSANDTITGSGMADLILPGDGVDVVDAGPGSDTVRISSVSAGETLGGGAGLDTLDITYSGSFITSVDDFFNTATVTGFERVSFANIPSGSSLLGTYAHFDFSQLGAGIATNATFTGGPTTDHVVFELPSAGGSFSLAG